MFQLLTLVIMNLLTTPAASSAESETNGQYGDCMETVWKMILFMEIYGKISLEIVWGFHGEHIANQITRLTPY